MTSEKDRTRYTQLLKKRNELEFYSSLNVFSRDLWKNWHKSPEGREFYRLAEIFGRRVKYPYMKRAWRK